MSAVAAPAATVLELRRLDTSNPGWEQQLDALIAFEAAQDPSIDTTVAAIVADIRARGDAALLEYTVKFDRMRAPSVAALTITATEMRAAFKSLR